MDITATRDLKLHVGKIQNLTEQLNQAIDKWYNMDGCSVKVTQLDEPLESRPLDKKPTLVIRCFKEVTD